MVKFNLEGVLPDAYGLSMGIGKKSACDPVSITASNGKKCFETGLLQEMHDLKCYALSLTQNPTDAEDLVQDCVLRAVSRQHMFKPGTKLRNWLFTILRNIHFDHCRKLPNRQTHLALSDSGHELSQPPSQDSWMELVETAQAMRTLRKDELDILILNVFSPMSQKEIAEYLGIAEGTVRSRLSRTRAMLDANRRCGSTEADGHKQAPDGKSLDRLGYHETRSEGDREDG